MSPTLPMSSSVLHCQALLVLLGAGSACIDSARGGDARDGDTVTDATGDSVADTHDTAADTHEDVDPTTEDVAGTRDVSEDADTRVDPPCLPTGCTEPGAGCALTPGWCWIGGCVADGTANPAETCEACDAKEDPRGYTRLRDGEPCDDGVSCTASDACRQGHCEGKTDCGSAQSCVTPVCDVALDGCVRAVDQGRCFIGERCQSTGEFSVDGCGSCDPSVSQSRWTPGDRNEPDDAVTSAHQLAYNGLLVANNTNWNGPWLGSRLSPASDVDSFQFTFATAAGFSRPTIRVRQLAPDVALEACISLRCRAASEATTTPTPVAVCGGNERKIVLEGGWVGCCRTTTTTPQFDQTLNSGWCELQGQKVVADADALVQISRVVPPPEPECLAYELSWGVR